MWWRRVRDQAAQFRDDFPQVGQRGQIPRAEAVIGGAPQAALADTPANPGRIRHPRGAGHDQAERCQRYVGCGFPALPGAHGDAAQGGQFGDGSAAVFAQFAQVGAGGVKVCEVRNEPGHAGLSQSGIAPGGQR